MVVEVKSDAAEAVAGFLWWAARPPSGGPDRVVHGDREQLVRLGTVRNATLDVLTGCHLVEQPD